MLVAISNYLKPLQEVDLHRSDHHKYLTTLFAEDKLLISGRQNNKSGGVIIAKAILKDEFEKILANDPFVVAGVTRYEVYEFTPSFCDELITEFYGGEASSPD